MNFKILISAIIISVLIAGCAGSGATNDSNSAVNSTANAVSQTTPASSSDGNINGATNQAAANSPTTITTSTGTNITSGESGMSYTVSETTPTPKTKLPKKKP